MLIKLLWTYLYTCIYSMTATTVVLTENNEHSPKTFQASHDCCRSFDRVAYSRRRLRVSVICFALIRYGVRCREYRVARSLRDDVERCFCL